MSPLNPQAPPKPATQRAASTVTAALGRRSVRFLLLLTMVFVIFASFTTLPLLCLVSYTAGIIVGLTSTQVR